MTSSSQDQDLQGMERFRVVPQGLQHCFEGESEFGSARVPSSMECSEIFYLDEVRPTNIKALVFSKAWEYLKTQLALSFGENSLATGHHHLWALYQRKVPTPERLPQDNDPYDNVSEGSASRSLGSKGKGLVESLTRAGSIPTNSFTPSGILSNTSTGDRLADTSFTSSPSAMSTDDEVDPDNLSLSMSQVSLRSLQVGDSASKSGDEDIAGHQRMAALDAVFSTASGPVAYTSKADIARATLHWQNVGCMSLQDYHEPSGRDWTTLNQFRDVHESLEQEKRANRTRPDGSNMTQDFDYPELTSQVETGIPIFEGVEGMKRLEQLYQDLEDTVLPTFVAPLFSKPQPAHGLVVPFDPEEERTVLGIEEGKPENNDGDLALDEGGGLPSLF